MLLRLLEAGADLAGKDVVALASTDDPQKDHFQMSFLHLTRSNKLWVFAGALTVGRSQFLLKCLHSIGKFDKPHLNPINWNHSRDPKTGW